MLSGSEDGGAAFTREERARARERGWGVPVRDILLVCVTVALTATVMALQRPHSAEVEAVARQLVELQAAVHGRQRRGESDVPQSPRRGLQDQERGCVTEREATALLMQGVGELHETHVSMTRRLDELVVAATKKVNASVVMAQLDEMSASVASAASVADLEALRQLVGLKAAASDVDAQLEGLAEAVARKAEAAHLSSLASTVDELGASERQRSGGDVTLEAVTAIATSMLDEKADASALDAFASTVCLAPCAVPVVDCVGEWSSCSADCGNKVYNISTPKSGSGRACDAADGESRACAHGEGDCASLPDRGICGGVHPPVDSVTDVECGAGFVYNVANARRSCQGTVCDVTTVPADKATCCIAQATCGDVDGAGPGSRSVTDEMCGPGFVYNSEASNAMCAGALCDFLNVASDQTSCCVAGTHCVGSWSTCAADCGDQTYSISTSQSGAGSRCATVDGATRACMYGDGHCARTLPRTCGDTNADGVADGFPCRGNLQLASPADRVTCATELCTEAECCVMCADDSAWSFFDRGVHYDCAGFVAQPALGVASCEETWALASDVNGDTVNAYKACQVSCPPSATDRSCATEQPEYPCRGFSCPATDTTGPTFSTADMACTMAGACTVAECCVPCEDDLTWRVFRDGINRGCAAFVNAHGVEACEADWAVGTNANGASVTAYDACAVSCPASESIRQCNAPGLPRTCADTDADGTWDLFNCPSGNTGLVYPADSVACAGNPCTPTECCTTCADDQGWIYSDRGQEYHCASFVATGPGLEACESFWAIGTNSSGSTVIAYEACPVSCPASATSRSCEACPAGTVPHEGTCTACTAGKFDTGTGNCTNCPPGQYVAVPSSSECINCATGKYAPVAGSDTAADCLDCAAGQYVSAAGSFECINCAAGKYGSVTGSDTSFDCLDCAVGKYVSVTGSSECVGCPTGKHQPLTGQSHCVQRSCIGEVGQGLYSGHNIVFDCGTQYISDGGSDMYDGGAYVSIYDSDTGAALCERMAYMESTDFEVRSSDCFGSGGEYVYGRQASGSAMFLLTTNNHNAPLEFRITGNLGADGRGQRTGYDFNLNAPSGRQLRAFGSRVCAASDPSINHLFIFRPDVSPAARLTQNTDTSNEDVQFQSIGPGSPMIWILFASRSGACESEATFQAVAQAMVDCLHLP